MIGYILAGLVIVALISIFIQNAERKKLFNGAERFLADHKFEIVKAFEYLAMNLGGNEYKNYEIETKHNNTGSIVLLY